MGSQLRTLIQPIVDGVTGRVIAHEVLLRSAASCDDSPLALYAAADRKEQHALLETQARRLALERLPDLPPPQRLFVNVDISDLAVPLWPDGTDLDASRIVLELSARTSIDRTPTLAKSINRWRDQGCDIALDNYGAGPMGLSEVLAIRPQIVKISRTLVQHLHADPVRQAMVQAVVDLCSRLKITVIALGVETPDEFWAVRDAGIRYLQGFLLAYPGPDALTRVRLPLRRQAPLSHGGQTP